MKTVGESIRDECNNPLMNSELNVIINLIPSLEKGIYINFSIFDFIYYNGNKYIKFIKKPNPLEKEQKYVFIYVNDIENSVTIGTIKESIDKIIKIKNFWKVISHIYIIISIDSKDKIKKIYESLPPEFIPNSKKGQTKVSTIFLREGGGEDMNSENFEKGGEMISIFLNRYKTKKSNYFFILDNNNKVIKRNEVQFIFEFFNVYIKGLIFKQNDPVEVAKNKKKIKDEKFKEFFEYLLNFIKNIKKLNYLFNFQFSLRYKVSINNEITDINLKNIQKIKLKGDLKKNDYNIFKEYFSLINNKKILFELKEIESIDITDIDFNSEIKCKICNKIINKNIFHYYCYLCKENYCSECVNSNYFNPLYNKENNNLKKKFIDNRHNLLCFKTNDKNSFISIETKKLGKNLFSLPQYSDKNYLDCHSCNCDSCGGSLCFNNSPRYICLNCRPGVYSVGGYNDYCFNCIEKMEKDDEYKKKIKDNEQICYNDSKFIYGHQVKYSHDHDKHVYLMVALEISGCGYENY